MGSPDDRDRYAAVLAAGSELDAARTVQRLPRDNEVTSSPDRSRGSDSAIATVRMLREAIHDPSVGVAHQAVMRLLHDGRQICRTEVSSGTLEGLAGVQVGRLDEALERARGWVTRCSQNPVAGDAAMIIGVLGDSQDREALHLQGRSSGNDYARLHAADALQHLGDREAARSIHQALLAEDPGPRAQPGARFYAYAALARLDATNQREPRCTVGTVPPRRPQ